MKETIKNKEFSFKKPAIYKIVVQGEIDAEWSDRLWGLQVNIAKVKNKRPITSLVGQINDQAALAGILCTLYDMHMTVISVYMLSEIEK